MLDGVILGILVEVLARVAPVPLPIVDGLGDPQPPLFVEGHRGRVEQHRRLGPQLHLHAFGDDEALVDVLGGRARSRGQEQQEGQGHALQDSEWP